MQQVRRPASRKIFASPAPGEAAHRAGEGGFRMALRQPTQPSPAAFGVDLSREGRGEGSCASDDAQACTGGVFSLSSRVTTSSGRSKAPPKPASICVYSGLPVPAGGCGTGVAGRVQGAGFL
jgi:hypothetical protein